MPDASLGSAGGPVSAALEEELRGELRKGIVVWLDKDGLYTDFVDQLALRHVAGEFPVPVVGFRGSFLKTLFALEPYGSSLDNLPLLVHMPGFNEETIRATPVLELYDPGIRFRKSLDTLVREAARGRVAPDEVERFLLTAPKTVAEADAWLVGQMSSATEGFAARLDHVGLSVVLDGLLGKNGLFKAPPTPPNLEALRGYLYRHAGMDEAWLAFFARGGADPKASDVENLASAFAGWLLAVEYVHDLARPPHLDALQPVRALSVPLVAACCELVRHLRAHNPDAYVELADETEVHLQGELDAMRAEDLGRIDTFRTEELRILEAAVASLKAGEWAKAREWAGVRSGDASFWLQRDQARRWTWTLVGEAA